MKQIVRSPRKAFESYSLSEHYDVKARIISQANSATETVVAAALLVQWLLTPWGGSAAFG
jgi:hypothetical protein